MFVGLALTKNANVKMEMYAIAVSESCWPRKGEIAVTDIISAVGISPKFFGASSATYKPSAIVAYPKYPRSVNAVAEAVRNPEELRYEQRHESAEDQVQAADDNEGS